MFHTQQIRLLTHHNLIAITVALVDFPKLCDVSIYTLRTPQEQMNGDAIGNPNIFYPGQLEVTAPVYTTTNPSAEQIDHWGRITIHQVEES